MIKPWHEWMLMWGYEVAAGPPEITDEFARELAVQLVGTEDFEMRVTSRLPWTVNHHFATTVARGRVFCVGDAVHRHPPTNGLGSNTSIQDSYNLAWKLAAVIKGHAGADLLETYSQERAPVARQIVTRANKSSREFVQFFEVLGLTDAETEDEMRQQIEERKANTPRGRAKREALVKAMELKNYEFNAHGVELGQFYESTAIQGDGSSRPAPVRDPELYYQASTVPGSHLPHAWVGGAARHGASKHGASKHGESKHGAPKHGPARKVSTLDLAPYGTFTLITGIAGEPWAA